MVLHSDVKGFLRVLKSLYSIVKVFRLRFRVWVQGLAV